MIILSYNLSHTISGSSSQKTIMIIKLKNILFLYLLQTDHIPLSHSDWLRAISKLHWRNTREKQCLLRKIPRLRRGLDTLAGFSYWNILAVQVKRRSEKARPLIRVVRSRTKLRPQRQALTFTPAAISKLQVGSENNKRRIRTTSDSGNQHQIQKLNMKNNRNDILAQD